MRKLARKPPATLQGLMDKIEEFINQEETLKALTSARRREKGSWRKRGSIPRSPGKKFKDFDFTQLITRVCEVMIKINDAGIRTCKVKSDVCQNVVVIPEYWI
jgi:hypothetical protein